jgi:hypothetical protein
VIHACVSYCAIPNLSTVQYRTLNPIEPLCNGDNVIIAIQQPCFIFSQIRYRRIDEIVWIQRSTAAEMSEAAVVAFSSIMLLVMLPMQLST